MGKSRIFFLLCGQSKNYGNEKCRREKKRADGLQAVFFLVNTSYLNQNNLSSYSELKYPRARLRVLF